MITIGQWLKKDLQIPYRDRESILQYVLKKKRTDLYTSLSQPLSKAQAQDCEKLRVSYKEGYPLAYLFGETGFYGNTFQISEGVFIPRFETEILVDQVLKKYFHYQDSAISILDFGSGSGCIGLSLLAHYKKAHLYAVDVSEQALSCTWKNAVALGFKSRVSLVHTDVAHLNPGHFPPIQWITANPPYISRKDQAIHSSVLKYEPHQALFADQDGIKEIEVWLEKAMSFFHYTYKKGQGMEIQNLSYFFEVGYNQFHQVSQLLEKYSPIKDFQWYTDYQGIQRVVQCSF